VHLSSYSGKDQVCCREGGDRRTFFAAIEKKTIPIKGEGRSAQRNVPSCSPKYSLGLLYLFASTSLTCRGQRRGVGGGTPNTFLEKGLYFEDGGRGYTMRGKKVVKDGLRNRKKVNYSKSMEGGRRGLVNLSAERKSGLPISFKTDKGEGRPKRRSGKPHPCGGKSTHNTRILRT